MGKAGLIVAVALLLMGATARDNNWPKAYFQANGEPVLRAILTPDSTTAEDNSNASGGAAVVYASFSGGEFVCIQSAEAAYVQFNVASASMGAAGAAAGLYIPATSAPICRYLSHNTKKISALCVTGSCTRIAISEQF